MSLKERVESDFVEAFKKKEQNVVSTLRILKAAIKNEEIDRKKELNDEETAKVIRSEIKKRRDSIIDYKKGGREDLARKEELEIDILNSYLPPELSDEELEKIVAGVVAGLGRVAPKDFGRVMGAAMKETAGRASGDRVSEAVRKKLETGN